MTDKTITVVAIEQGFDNLVVRNVGDVFEMPADVFDQRPVLDANGKDKFAFSFSSNCPVTVTIYKEQDEVIVELIEDNIPVDNGRIFKHYTSNTMGWTFYLTNLKSVLEGGLDLRNFNPSLQNVITA